MLGCTILSIGAILQFTSTGIPQMIVGRIVTGLGNGMNTSTVPVWHSECTLPKNRGRALGIELAINIFGVVSGIDLNPIRVDTSAQRRTSSRCPLTGSTTV